MRNKRLIIALAGAIVCGLIAAYSVSTVLKAQGTTNGLNNVVVAKVDIPLGAKIIEEELTTVQFPSGATPDESFSSTEKVAGRIAIRPLVAKEPITETKLAPEGSAGGLSAVIPEGYRAMTVKVDDVVGISGFVQPGALVDVVVVIEPPENASSRDPVSKIVLQNIKVLANGQNIDRPKDDREAKSAKAVTLQVKPEQAEKLALAATEGKLQLVMRNSTDQQSAETPGANKRSLLTGERALPVPEPGIAKSERTKAAARPRPRIQPVRDSQLSIIPPVQIRPRDTVEMFEGSKKRTVDFP